MLEKRIIGTDDSAPTLTRYVYSNHLQSASLELDEEADIISYEEYHPYGTTAFQAKNASINAVAKRYRYTGKERDEESGLYYHGARYYIPWLARWTAIDPMESKYAGRTPYCYGANNPVIFNDPDGMQEKKGTEQVEQLGGWYKTPKGEMKFYKGDVYGNEFKASGIKGDFQGEVNDDDGIKRRFYRGDGKIIVLGESKKYGGGKASSSSKSAVRTVEKVMPVKKELQSLKMSVQSENTNSFVTWNSLKSSLMGADNWIRHKVQNPMGNFVLEHGQPIQRGKDYLKSASELGSNFDFGIKYGIFEANLSIGLFSTHESNFGFFASGDFTFNIGGSLNSASGISTTLESWTAPEFTTKLSFYATHEDKPKLTAGGAIPSNKNVDYSQFGISIFEFERESGKDEKTDKLGISLLKKPKFEISGATGLKNKSEIKSKSGLFWIGQ